MSDIMDTAPSWAASKILTLEAEVDRLQQGLRELEQLHHNQKATVREARQRVQELENQLLGAFHLVKRGEHVRTQPEQKLDAARQVHELSEPAQPR